MQFNQYQYNQDTYEGVNSPATSTSVITAVCKTQEGLPFPKFLAGGVGGQGGNNYKLFSKATTYSLNVWRSQLFTIDSPFSLSKIELSLSTNLNQNHIITPILYFDNGGTMVTGTEINATNYPNGETGIVLTPGNFAYNVHGQNNFILELRFTGTALIAVTLPISIELETEDVG
jgi:hypothetical protein